MSIADQIEQIRSFPASSSEAFREQLERARISREQMDGSVSPATKGMDRSGDLTPVTRPTIVRSVGEAA